MNSAKEVTISKPFLGCIVSDDPDCIKNLSRQPTSLSAQHTFVFQVEEERIDLETALMLHRYHDKAFQVFPEFSSDRMDPVAGLPKEKYLSLSKDTCPDFGAINKSSWPWKNIDPGVTFDAGLTLGLPANSSQAPILLITISARYPMIHLAWLWALQKESVRLFPLFVVDKALMIMGVDWDKPWRTQIEITFLDQASKLIFNLLRPRHVQETLIPVLAVPRTLESWLESDSGGQINHCWNNHALFRLVRAKGQTLYKPVRDDEMIRKMLSGRELQSSEISTSADELHAA